MSMPRSSTAHLIYGPTAAGKSTYARKLAAQKQAVRFAIDEWMHALFAPDKPAKMDMAWVMPRVARCQARIWDTSKQILATGNDVVLELGLLRAQDRDSMRSLVEAAGFATSFCFVDADLQVRRNRVVQRNADKGETYSFDITPAMFEFMETCFERPNAAELSRSQAIFESMPHG
jgi:predicted kinase